MTALKPEVVLPALAVMQWKTREMHKMEAAIVRHALVCHYVYPGDIPEDTVAEASRQGVASNAWNVLEAAEVIQKTPLAFNDEARKIFGGRKRNTNPKAKGRWASVYFLKSRVLAEELLRRIDPQHGVTGKAEQMTLGAITDARA